MGEHPVVVLLGALAAIAAIATFVLTYVVDDESPLLPSGPCGEPAIALSDGAGPSGTAVLVTGSGFRGSSSVDLRFHTESLTPSRTDADGRFEQEVRIPGSFDPFAPQQFDIVAATGACSARTPFRLEP